MCVCVRARARDCASSLVTKPLGNCGAELVRVSRVTKWRLVGAYRSIACGYREVRAPHVRLGAESPAERTRRSAGEPAPSLVSHTDENATRLNSKTSEKSSFHLFHSPSLARARASLAARASLGGPARSPARIARASASPPCHITGTPHPEATRGPSPPHQRRAPPPNQWRASLGGDAPSTRWRCSRPPRRRSTLWAHRRECARAASCAAACGGSGRAGGAKAVAHKRCRGR